MPRRGCSEDTLKLYIDGTLAQTLFTTSSISYSGLGSNTLLGKHGNGNTNYDFNGTIDDARVYNHAMNAEEVRNLKRTNQPRGVRVIKWVELP